MQPTKFWHELTEQQQHFLTLLASGEEANIELAKQLLLSLLREQYGEDYLAGVDCLSEPQNKAETELIAKFENHQQDFFANVGLPTAILPNALSFLELSKSLTNFSCSRGYVWQGNSEKNKYIYYPPFQSYNNSDSISAYKANSIAMRIELEGFSAFLSYPFGYEGSIIFTFVINKRSPLWVIIGLCCELSEINPTIIFRFTTEKVSILQKIKLLDHEKVLGILSECPTQKGWLMNVEDVTPMLLHGREPMPNPDYLVLQNTCFYVRKYSNGATNPAQGWLDILVASPEWKERNLTYKFID